MKLYLMRHGETDYNQRRCFYGNRDVSINAKGKEQALQIKKIMAGREVDVIYTSQLRRTQETAQLIFGNQPFQPLSGLNERPFGLWEGLNADQIEAKDPDTWGAWLDNPFEVTPAGAEPFLEFKERVEQTLAELLSQSALNSIAIVAHLGVLRLIYQNLVDPTADFWQIDFPQGKVTCFKKITHWQSVLLKGGDEEID